jgi:hypothetical protein
VHSGNQEAGEYLRDKVFFCFEFEQKMLVGPTVRSQGTAVITLAATRAVGICR